MKQHLRRSFLYLNSQFEKQNENRALRPNKNIVLPILNVQFRTEGFDVKDINLYVDNPDFYYKSFLINKYHDKWAIENEIDTFIDDVVEDYCTYGGVLVRNTYTSRPLVVDLRSIAFCNQTDILNYPFAIKHKMSFKELRDMKPWGNADNGATVDIETLISMVDREGKNTVEVYEVHGALPVEWIEYEDNKETEKYVNQIQIVAYYKKEEENEVGVTLFKKKEPKLPFKFLSRDKIIGRALGRGGVEELFESQVWTNWDEIKITEMLDSASKTLFWTDDAGFAERNNISDAENNEVFDMADSKKIQQIDTYPRNLAVFNDSVNRWEQHAQTVGSASESLLGEQPSSGTPFKLFEAQTIEGKGIHEYRKGKIAVFMDEIYRDWILPHLAKELVKEQTFLSELSADEFQEITIKLSENLVGRFIIESILEGEELNQVIIEEKRQEVNEKLLRGGNKRFFKIIKDEMKDISLSVSTNIAGKQKNLALLTDKLVNVLRQYISTPQIRQDPEMNKLLNTILESSGLSPIMFSPAPQQLATPQQQGGATEPLQDLAKAQQ
jgi:hypothetical protein